MLVITFSSELFRCRKIQDCIHIFFKIIPNLEIKPMINVILKIKKYPENYLNYIEVYYTSLHDGELKTKKSKSFIS
jgi:hypothetical protein